MRQQIFIAILNSMTAWLQSLPLVSAKAQLKSQTYEHNSHCKRTLNALFWLCLILHVITLYHSVSLFYVQSYLCVTFIWIYSHCDLVNPSFVSGAMCMHRIAYIDEMRDAHDRLYSVSSSFITLYWYRMQCYRWWCCCWRKLLFDRRLK